MVAVTLTFILYIYYNYYYYLYISTIYYLLYIARRGFVARSTRRSLDDDDVERIADLHIFNHEVAQS